MFYLLDRLVLIQGTDVHRHDLAGFHIQHVFQKLVGQIRGRDRKITHRPVQLAHAECPAAGEGEGSRRNKILYGQPRFRQPLPFKIKAVLIAQMEQVVHELQALFPGQHLSHNTQPSKIVQKIGLDVDEPRLCLLHGFCLDAEGQVLGLGQAVIALGELRPQHLAVFLSDIVEALIFQRNTDIFLKVRCIRAKVHERQLKVDGAVKEI